MPTNKHWPQGRVSFTGMARSHKDFRLPLDSFSPLRCSNFMQKKTPARTCRLPSSIPDLFDQMFLIGIKRI